MYSGVLFCFLFSSLSAGFTNFSNAFSPASFVKLVPVGEAFKTSSNLLTCLRRKQNINTELGQRFFYFYLSLKGKMHLVERSA